MANVNEHQVSYLALEMPMGGWKTSGLGSRHGKDGIRKYARKQSSVVTRFGPKRELFMFPYTQAQLEDHRRRCCSCFTAAASGRRHSVQRSRLS